MYHNVDVPKYCYCHAEYKNAWTVYKLSEIKYKESQKREKKKKKNGKLEYSLLLTVAPFHFSNHSSMGYGCPEVWLVSILMLSQRALGVLIYNENELPQNIFKPALLESVQKGIILEVKVMSRRGYQH